MKKPITLLFLLMNYVLLGQVTNVTTNITYSTIQDALDAVQYSQVIEISPGTYNENLVWPERHDVILKGIGNSPTAVTIVGQSITEPTLKFEQNAYFIYDVSIENLTITGIPDCPKGVRIITAAVNFNNVIIENITGTGIEIYSRFNDPNYNQTINELTNCIIRNNQGGGIYVNDANQVNLTGVAIVDNKKEGGNCSGMVRGSGINNYETNVRIDNCTIANNYGIYFNTQYQVIQIAWAGAMYIENFTSTPVEVEINNSIIHSNGKWPVFTNFPAIFKISFSCFEEGSNDVHNAGGFPTYWDAGGTNTTWPGVGNFASQPGFELNCPHHPYSLNPVYSPCIDAGGLTSLPANYPIHDLQTGPRIYNGTIDIGAYEYNGESAFADLWTGDSDLDLGLEPNFESTNVWNSPEIWNRISNDGFVNQTNENPEYMGSTGSNYLYVKVKNRGQAESVGGVLKVYWTRARFQEYWPDHFIDVPANQINQSPGGSEITNAGGIPLSGIPQGSEKIYEIEWTPPNPDWYINDANPSLNGYPMLCFLSRIETTPESMFSELHGGFLPHNVILNNNIATKNTYVTDLVPNIPGTAVITVGINSLPRDMPFFNISLKAHPDNPDEFLNIMEAWLILDSTRMKLPENVYGGTGYDGHRFKMSEPTMLLDSIPNDSLLINISNGSCIGVQFIAKPIGELTEDKHMKFTLVCKDSLMENNYGAAMNFDVVMKAGNYIDISGINSYDSFITELSGFPNPANSSYTVNYNLRINSKVKFELYSVTGNLIKSFEETDKSTGQNSLTLSTDKLPSGSYYLRISSNSGSQKTMKFVVMH